jgi:hypothetical protein
MEISVAQDPDLQSPYLVKTLDSFEESKPELFIFQILFFSCFRRKADRYYNGIL